LSDRLANPEGQALVVMKRPSATIDNAPPVLRVVPQKIEGEVRGRRRGVGRASITRPSSRSTQIAGVSPRTTERPMVQEQYTIRVARPKEPSILPRARARVLGQRRCDLAEFRCRGSEEMKARFVVLTLCVATLTPGCARQGKDQTSVITRRLDGEPKTLNPLLGTSVPDMDVTALLFANLLEYDEKLNLLPGLAESVEADAAHRVYTVKFRPGAR
jgi:hypothetical protein